MNLRALALLGFSLIGVDAQASCLSQSILPDDQLSAIKADEEVYFRSAHAYTIHNNTDSIQNYRICNRIILDNGNTKSYTNEQCRDQRVKPEHTYSYKDNLYTYCHFNAKGKIIHVFVYSSIEGICNHKSDIRSIVKVY